jgi:hypothetical protein
LVGSIYTFSFYRFKHLDIHFVDHSRLCLDGRSERINIVHDFVEYVDRIAECVIIGISEIKYHGIVNDIENLGGLAVGRVFGLERKLKIIKRGQKSNV